MIARCFSLSLLIFMIGCGSKSPDTGDSNKDTGGPADTTDTGDSGASIETGDPADTGDTGSTKPGSERIALVGTVLLPTEAVEGAVVYNRTTGIIECAGADCDTTATYTIQTGGVISPGLIDTHNHLQYNAIPPWQHEELFDDRYDWRSDGDYWDYRTAYDEVSDTYMCEISKWAELRDLVGGSTSAVGQYGSSCVEILVRNLDEDESAHDLDDYGLYYSSSTVDDVFDEEDGADFQDDLESGYYEAVLNHVAEGVGGSVRSEIDHMESVGMTGEGQAFVHATDATTAQLAAMAESQTAIIWSPRSNLDLYADTTNADVAMRMGVPVVLAPDWTWSGSMNPLHELKCASEFLSSRGDAKGSALDNQALWEMVTGEAAYVVGAENFIGQLAEGMVADIVVFAASDDDPYEAVIQAGNTDVQLVILGGQALYGDSDWVSELAAKPEWCESVDVCGTERSICVQASSSGDDSQTYEELQTLLDASLSAVSMPDGFEYAAALHGIWECEDTRASCDLSSPTSDDTDGDGVDDLSDVCANAWDPLQADHDADGVGDVCDPCPLNPTSDVCDHDPADIDGDGVASTDDVCPTHYDPEQADADGDGLGDLCDSCPNESNLEGGCTRTISQLRDTTDPEHPKEGEQVRVSDVVVTGIREGNGFYVQDPNVSSYGGLFVYDTGDAEVSVGDIVDLEGEYLEYYGLTEIAYATTTVTGSSTAITAITVDTCDIATGGASAEMYESMLVSVENVEVTDANPDAADGDAKPDYGELELDSCLRVDDELWDVDSLRTEGLTLTRVLGVLTYRYSENKLLPRSDADVVE